MSPRDIDSRDADEAVRITEQALGDSDKTERDFALGQERLEEEDDESVHDELARLREDNARIEGLMDDTIALVQKHIALNPNQVGQAAREHDLEKLRLRKIEGIVERGGLATILIHPTANRTENWPVPLGLNGETIYVARGIPTQVPVEFLMVLEEAKQSQIAPVVTPAGDVLKQHVAFLSYPYSLIDVKPGKCMLKMRPFAQAA